MIASINIARNEATYDVQRIRRDFKALAQRVREKPLIYLDNAATAHKPVAVLDALMHYYTADCANIHRGVHALAERATESYENARRIVQAFIGARLASEVIFTSGTTGAVNLVAQTYGRQKVGAGDEIVVSALEHHSNLVPWQMLAQEKGAAIRVIPVSDAGELDLTAFAAMLSPKVKIVAVNHVSNAIGTINPVAEITRLAHAHGAAVLVDGAQAAPHLQIDVQAIGCDFYALSGHKVYGPTGIGALFGKMEHLEAMPPYQGGGEMISVVTYEKSTYAKPPAKFEAGTPNIAGAIGMGAALEYVERAGLAGIAAHEHDLLVYGTRALGAIEGVRLIGTARDKAAVLSFVLDGVHPHDIGTILDREGIAVRAGHHCAQPLMQRFGVPATVRASLAMYNTREEIDALVAGIKKVREIFS